MSTELTVGVVGLGYVGLPLAVQAAEKGYKVIGVDLNADLVDLINDRKSPFANDIRFEKALARIDSQKLIASTTFQALEDVQNIVICVPTPTENNNPDISFVTSAVEKIAGIIRPGQFIALESTVNPGVTRDEVKPILEKLSGLKVGTDIFLAHCPERIDPGNKEFYVGNLNRVVGGITPACTTRAVEFYRSIIDSKVIALTSTEEAEFVKSWENSYRNVMIAMANSAALICDALDMNIDNVLMGLQSKIEQFGLSLASPGIGPGGHCIPEDIHYVIKKARQNGIDTRLLDDAAELNDRMPSYAVQGLADMIKSQGEHLENLNVALLGLAYKPNVDDMRKSPSIEAAHQLARRAASLILHDPCVKTKKSPVKGVVLSTGLDDVLESADAIFIGTAHDEYKKYLNVEMLKKHKVKYVMDGRNCLDMKQFYKSGINYQGIGRGKN